MIQITPQMRLLLAVEPVDWASGAEKMPWTVRPRTFWKTSNPGNMANGPEGGFGFDVSVGEVARSTGQLGILGNGVVDGSVCRRDGTHCRFGLGSCWDFVLQAAISLICWDLVKIRSLRPLFLRDRSGDRERVLFILPFATFTTKGKP